MDNPSMIYAMISLFGVQFLAVLLGAIIYSRQKSALDIEKRDRGTFGTRVDKALQAAQDALLGVERIDIEQYRALAKKLADAIAETEMLKAKVLALEESIKSLSNKVASRDRADARAAAKGNRDEEYEREAMAATGGMSRQEMLLEDLKERGVAVPLFPNDPPPSNNGRPSFGRNLSKGG